MYQLATYVRSLFYRIEAIVRKCETKHSAHAQYTRNFNYIMHISTVQVCTV